jgi:glyoxylase-like metal-dependent hydrolase (beta-lactamase superfamily II)
MFVKCLKGGGLETNCYILCDKVLNRAAVIDPGFDSARILTALRETECTADYVLLTHGHYDHLAGAGKVAAETGAILAAFEAERPLIADPQANLAAMLAAGPFDPVQVDEWLAEGQLLRVGKLEIRVLHTPGHTHGSCCFICQDSIFCGDTLFKDGAGRTDFPTGSREELGASFAKLAALEGEFHLFPGHGEQTTLSRERELNPYMPREQAE